MATGSVVSGYSSRSEKPYEPQMAPGSVHGSTDLGLDKPPPPATTHYFDEPEDIRFSCQNGSLLLKISSALMVTSFVVQTVAVGAPYWSAGWKRDKMNWHEGVWMTCFRETLDDQWVCGSYDYGNKDYTTGKSIPGVPAWYTFCQAMGIISIVIFLPALMVNLFYTMHPKGKMFRGLRSFNFVLTFITGLLPLMMVIAWIAGHPKKYRFPIPYKDKDYLDYPFQIHFCWIFEIFAFIISFTAFGLEIHDHRMNDYL